MAVQHPVARITGYELHVTRLGYSHEHGVSRSPCRFGLATSLRSRGHDLVAVEMDRMVVHAEVDQADADSFPLPHGMRSVGGPGCSVEGAPSVLHGTGGLRLY